MKEPQSHPLKPFFPAGARLLMLGSFPPSRERWCMDFFYPNFQNDMWRIFGLVFFDDPAHFVIKDKKLFDKLALEEFLSEKKIAFYDTAVKVVRLRGNASDKFLEIAEPLDLKKTLAVLPNCEAVAATGGKAAEELGAMLSASAPEQGGGTDVEFIGRKLRFYRMPSSSRAYPKPLAEKAAAYKRMFDELGMI